MGQLSLDSCLNGNVWWVASFHTDPVVAGFIVSSKLAGSIVSFVIVYHWTWGDLATHGHDAADRDLQPWWQIECKPCSHWEDHVCLQEMIPDVFFTIWVPMTSYDEVNPLSRFRFPVQPAIAVWHFTPLFYHLYSHLPPEGDQDATANISAFIHLDTVSGACRWASNKQVERLKVFVFCPNISFSDCFWDVKEV